MPKLSIETLDKGARVNVSVGGDCDADVETRFHIPRPSSRPPAPLDDRPLRRPAFGGSVDDVPTERRMTIPRPPAVPRFRR